MRPRGGTTAWRRGGATAPPRTGARAHRDTAARDGLPALDERTATWQHGDTAAHAGLPALARPNLPVTLPYRKSGRPKHRCVVILRILACGNLTSVAPNIAAERHQEKS